MRALAFGYSSFCNIKCSHCVAAKDSHDTTKMDLSKAKEVIVELSEAGVNGVSFTAGEPLVFFDDLIELVTLCRELNIYTRVVTNCFWAADKDVARDKLVKLKKSGLSQLRMSFSRWHQQHIPEENIKLAVKVCEGIGLDYFVSFVTDFSNRDEIFESFLRKHKIKFFPEPLIYHGRAKAFERPEIFTDYQLNTCQMNSYISPDFNMYGCCDAGSYFTTTDFFLLGNINTTPISELFDRFEKDILYNCIRTLGISTIASYLGMSSKEIVTYQKCELCSKLFNSPKTLKKLRKAAQTDLISWRR
jgi:MoaA/NifB/PqqE/SkfB family radical SAM enzyme